MKRAEISRKRKNQSDQKLEDEVRCPFKRKCTTYLTRKMQKQETINRLLKKQVGKVKKGTKKSDDAEGDEDSNVPTAPVTPPPPAIPTMYRWVSSIRQDNYTSLLAIPLSKIEVYQSLKAPSYPGPRPPPKTRRLVTPIA